MKGSIVSTIGVILPSLLIIMLVVEFLRGFGDNQYVAGALKGIRPAAAALITWAAIKLGARILRVRKILPWVLAAASFLIVTFTDISAVWPIVAGIICGIAYTEITAKRAAEAPAGSAEHESAKAGSNDSREAQDEEGER